MMTVLIKHFQLKGIIPSCITGMESVPLLDSKDSIEVLCMGCYDSKCDFRAIKMRRRVMRDEDIEIDMKYCGVCHSDLHKAAGHLDAVGTETDNNYTRSCL
jgi:hypothetical protein